MWFVAGVWVFIWGRFMTNGQIGISDAITFLVGFLVELPSGVFADLIGRRKAILIGNILLTIGNFCIAFSSSFLSITFFYCIWSVGYAFQSGATEALAYDSLKKLKLDNEWHRVISTSTVVGRVSTLLATAIGGFVFSVWFRLPYLIFGFSGCVGILSAYLLNEIQVSHKVDTWSLSSYINQIKDGLRVIVKPQVFPIALFSIFIASASYLYNWGLLRPLTGLRFGFTTETFPMLLATISFVVIVALFIYSKLKIKRNVEQSIYFFGFLFSLIYVYMGFQHSWFMGGTIMILFAVFAIFVEQLFSQFINEHTEAKHRATTLSAISLFTRLPYVILAAALGFIADKNMLPQLTWIVGIVLLFVFGVSYYRYKGSKSLSK